MPSGPPTHQVAPLPPLAPVPVSPTQLTSNNFNSFVHSGADSLVEFYADWCGACQQVGRCVRWISRYLHCCASSGPSSRPWRRVWRGTMSSAAWSTSTRSGSWPGSTGSPGASTFLAHRDTVSILRHALWCRVPHLVLVTNSTVHRYTDTDNIDTQPVFSWVQVSSSSHHLIILVSCLVSRAWCPRPARPPPACPRPPPPHPPPGGHPSHPHPGGPRDGLQ